MKYFILIGFVALAGCHTLDIVGDFHIDKRAVQPVVAEPVVVKRQTVMQSTEEAVAQK